MPTEEQCRKLVTVGIMSDLVDLAASIIPVAGELFDSLTDQVQINLERETLTNAEFDDLRRFYALPAGLRAMFFCYMKRGAP